MKRFIIFIGLCALITNTVKAQDSLGLKFGFGMLPQEKYTYNLIINEVTSNTKNALLDYKLDTMEATFVSKYVDSGILVDITFNPTKEKANIIYDVPLILHLDSSGKLKKMINHSQYRRKVYEGIDDYVKQKEYTEAYAAEQKIYFSSNKNIENLILPPFEDFFSFFGSQFRPGVEYLINKPVELPFTQFPYSLDGKAVINNIAPKEGIYYFFLEAESTPLQRKELTEIFRSYLVNTLKNNKNMQTPPVDVGYNYTLLFNRKKGLVNSLRVVDKLKVGEEIKTMTYQFTIR